MYVFFLLGVGENELSIGLFLGVYSLGEEIRIYFRGTVYREFWGIRGWCFYWIE